jgi:hypothetical protein
MTYMPIASDLARRAVENALQDASPPAPRRRLLARFVGAAGRWLRADDRSRTGGHRVLRRPQPE